MNFYPEYRNADATLRRAVEAVAEAWFSGQEILEVHTSGSTGPPKRIELRRDQLEASASRTLTYFGLQPGDTALLGLSPATIGGKMMIIRALIGGLKLLITPPSSDPLSALLPDEIPDFCPMVPLQAQQLLLHRPQDLARIRTVLFGGAPMPAQLETMLQTHHPGCFIGFGMTETVSHIAMRQPGNQVYNAMDGVRFSLSGQGNLVIHDQQLGIANLQTNDQADFIDDTHFRWLGRADFAINSGGIKLHPEQLEQVLSAYIRGPFFIASEPDVTFGEKCILILDADTQAPPLSELQAHCRNQIGPYAAPRALYQTQIIYTESRKINRRATLQQLFEGR